MHGSRVNVSIVWLKSFRGYNIMLIFTSWALYSVPTYARRTYSSRYNNGILVAWLRNLCAGAFINVCSFVLL